MTAVNGTDGAMCHGRDLHSHCHAPTAEKEWEVAATRTTGERETGAGSLHTTIFLHLSVPRGSRTSQVNWLEWWRLNDAVPLVNGHKTKDQQGGILQYYTYSISMSETSSPVVFCFFFFQWNTI